MNRRLVLAVVSVSWLVPGISPVRGDVHEAFESAATTWQLGPRDCAVTISRHERQFTGAHGGRGCEHFEFSAGPGTSIQLVHAVTPCLIIRELVPSLWVKSDLPGVRLQARVVFPRSVDRDGKPLSALVDGDSYTQARSWRQLRIDDVHLKVQRAVVGLRTRPGLRVDDREAYIDRIVLNAYTEPRLNRIWIDDLELSGFVEAKQVGGEGGAESHRPTSVDGETAARPVALAARDGLQGSVLMKDGQPMFVRAIEHRGETLAFLQSLGFNAVLVGSRPTESLLEEAKRTEISLITAPPSPVDGSTIAAAHAPIIAWFLGENLTGRDADHIQGVVRTIRQDEKVLARPILFHVAQDYARFRHDSGVLLFDRSVISTSFEPTDFGPWLVYAARFGRAGAPFWAAIPTDIPAVLSDQVARMSRVATPSILAEPDVVRLLAFEAVAEGARGLWFRSGQRLDARDPATQLRCAVLQSVNRELELVAPWVAAGKALGERLTDNPRLRIRTLATETAQLLVATRIISDQQFVAAPSRSSESLVFRLPGAPLSDRAYLVTPQGIAPVPVQRGGGVQLTLDASQPVSLVLLTQDPLAVNYVGRISAETRQDYAMRQLEIAERVLDETETVNRQLAARPVASVAAESELQRARADLRQATRLLDTGDARNALPLVERSREVCRGIRRRYWESAVLSFPSPLGSPLCATFSTLPLHFAVADRLAGSPWSPNVLAAGEMEQLEHLLQSGWRQERMELHDVEMDVRLSLESPHAGRACLQLRAWEGGTSREGIQGQWPLTISSAPFPVRAGQLVRIHGWVKIPRRFSHSWDGLLIFDSQTGPELAERVYETQGWREFLLYRVATADGNMQVIFAQTGLGDAWIDDVSVTLQDPP